MQIKEYYIPWAVENNWGIEITQGKFEGSVIQIETLDFAEEETGQLQVDFHTINIPDGILKEDYETSEFTDMMQLIISDIIAEAIRIHEEEK